MNVIFRLVHRAIVAFALSPLTKLVKAIKWKALLGVALSHFKLLL